MEGKRRKYTVGSAVGVAVVSVTMPHFAGAVGSAGFGAVILPLWYGWSSWKSLIQPAQVVAPVSAAESTYGASLVLRRSHLASATFVEPAPGEQLVLEVNVPTRGRTLRLATEESLKRLVRLTKPATLRLLRRSMVHVNTAGTRPGQLDRAADILQAEGVAGYLPRLPEAGMPLMSLRATRPEETLTLEMALNEDEERRAMNGELAMLEAAWREAEGIAAIADRLPDEPPPTA